ncbi:DENN domain-containing protein 11-like [Ylistrum balloti]|uniref:DENN domain-containing protein 11-like n=1 Tax=Ylistrum balloti TaxID=509963 RepID=UPI002905A5D3|nr:DENN domain-containing protein 11-like [Ylistrum balloti]
MAADERAPLLKFSEEDDYDGPRNRKTNYRLPSQFPGLGDPADDFILPLPLSETDHIVCVFVVTFDTRSGNMIEWCMPEDFDLDGVEFKAMVSGSHTMTKDFVYFRMENLYGLACFENMPVESEIERGARMKSVGILSTSYTLLYRHMQFLETQVRHQLETPGNYSQLHAFYQDKKGTLTSDSAISGMSSSNSSPSTPSRDLPEMKITHPAGCFSQFIKFFGESIFVLWKFALLQRRLLFFSPPPIGVVCYRVYCACCLANRDIPGLGHDMKPHFYVNIADIETLESEVAYIACTTEKIFEMKTCLYDVYIDNQIIKTHSPILKDMLKVSEADRDKYAKLNNQRSAHQFSYEELGEEACNEEELFTMFFTELNNRLFQTLLDVSMSQDRQLTSEHMKSMGLDPYGDRSFLMELVEHYGIDVVLMVDNPCCPK